MSDSPKTLLTATSICLDYPGKKDAINGVGLSLEAGTITTILGPNGSGKTTLMRALAGVLPTRDGELRFLDSPTVSGASWSTLNAIERAQKVAYLPQTLSADTPFLVRDVVGFGRFAHRGGRLFELPEDRHQVEDVMNRMGLLPLADRAFATLSGGERKRVHIARVMAQKAPILLLDEPVGDLDPRHQVNVFTTIRDWAEQDEGAALVSVHDVNLAARFSDHIVFMKGGQVFAAGAPSQVVTDEVLFAVFELPMKVFEDPGTGRPYALIR